jgi:hypothetical protein
MEDGGWRSNDEEWRIRKAGRQEGRKKRLERLGRVKGFASRDW